MALWLFKEEPDEYTYADLEREGRTVWDGVANALALKHLRQVKVGDRVLFYQTGKVKAVVGEMRVVCVRSSDKEEEEQQQADEKARQGVSVEVAPVRAFAQPVTLARVKADPELSGWDLVRLPRLSVMPVSEEQWRRIEELAGADG